MRANIVKEVLYRLVFVCSVIASVSAIGKKDYALTFLAAAVFVSSRYFALRLDDFEKILIRKTPIQ